MGPTSVYDGRCAMCEWQKMLRPQYDVVFEMWF